MTSATEMVQRITKLVLPTELASIFDSRLLQHIVMWDNERKCQHWAIERPPAHLKHSLL
jgi:hypothetical protein